MQTPDTCRGCPYHELYTARCVCVLMKDVFDLINRQKAKNEREINQIKSEAIKEFAKRLKSKVNDLEFRTKTHRKTVPTKFCDDNANWVMHECIPEEIDKLVKEMTEGE